MGRRGTDPGPRSPHRPSRPLLPAQPICLTIRLVASSEILEKMGAAAVSSEVRGPEQELQQAGDNNSPVTQLGQAPGVPAASHLSKHSRPFSGPHLHAWGWRWGSGVRGQQERQRLKQTRGAACCLILRPQVDVKGTPEGSSQNNKKQKGNPVKGL